MKNSYFENFIFGILLILLLVGILGHFNQSDKKDADEKNLTEIEFYNIDLKDVAYIEAYEYPDNKKILIEDKEVIKMILNSFELASYGKASHPSANNSDEIYINILGKSNQTLFLLFGVIMKEGPDKNVLYYSIKDKPTNRYKSTELYNLFVNEKIYDDKNRTFLIE